MREFIKKPINPHTFSRGVAFTLEGLFGLFSVISSWGSRCSKGVGINFVFCLHLLMVLMIGMGALPRAAVFGLLAVWVVFIFWRPPEDSLLLFLRLIPFFIALPLTASFDNFNMWRLILALIFLKWLFTRVSIKEKITWTKIKAYFYENRLELAVLVLFLLAVLSIFKAGDLMASFKRVVYFLNLGLLYFLVKDAVAKNKDFLYKACGAFLVGAGIAGALGVLQLIMAFALNIEEFHYFWAKQFELAFFGRNWSEIAFNANTWYSYSGGGLRLRIFSVFPDSHSYPIYLLVGLPVFFVWHFQKNRRFFESAPLEGEPLTGRAASIKGIIKKDLPVFLLIAAPIIFSQTRGIWLAILAPAILAVYYSVKKRKPVIFNKALFGVFVGFVLIFIVNFAISYIPQFKVKLTGEQGSVFLERLLSIGDMEETSNFGRIAIWRSSLKSIIANPSLGVGIGNFPVALGQDVGLAKAGSSAHNLYLTVAVELGILGGLVFLAVLWLILKNCWLILRNSPDIVYKALGFFATVSILWILAYSMTDAALFDERAFLGLMVMVGMVEGVRKMQNVNVKM